MNKRLFAVFAAMILLASTSGMTGTCGTPNPGPICTAIAVPSVVFQLTGPDGNTVPKATAFFTINNGDVMSASCDGTCDNFVLVYERAGVFNISVRSVGLKQFDLLGTVPSDADGCHPITQTRAVLMERDETAGILYGGVWRSTNPQGQSRIIRFDTDGKPIAAILQNFINTGDHNIYVAYNGAQVRGATGQTLLRENAPTATRVGNVCNWTTNSGGFPIGFENATLSSDFNKLTGTLIGDAIVYTRSEDIPAAIQDP